jgi:hypothetical protein
VQKVHSKEREAVKIKITLLEDSLRIIGFLSVVGFLVLDPLGIVAGNIFAAEETPPIQVSGDYRSIANTLGMIFILAVLIEVGLAVLFDWRVFLRYFEGKGVKVPITFIVSLIIVSAHGIDIPSEVVTAFSDKPANPEVTGYLISALIIAGGSASVNGIFTRLNWRNPALQAAKADKERAKMTGRIWVTVERPTGKTSDGEPVAVAIDDVPVGVLAPNEQTFGGKEGYQVQPGKRTVKATWTDSSGASHEMKEETEVAVSQSRGMTLTLT